VAQAGIEIGEFLVGTVDVGKALQITDDAGDAFNP
jgi:hypothetical protein